MNISAALRWDCFVRNVRLTAMLAVLAVLPRPAWCQQGTGAKSGENAASDGKAAQEAKDAAGLDLEQLASMNVKVTSVSKTEQSMSQVAAAIFVITQEDIRRSGATNIPDLLRMVPGMDVAQINANNWAISARGFNSQFANKLLVLIDGRAVYTPLLGGVNWDTQDVPLEDIERIEVIRGPGATLWGSNAVNGVINVITKKASETQGGLITAGGGTQQQAMALAQYGGKISKDASYRVFTKYLDDGHLPDLNGENARDGWHLLHGGFRVDDTLSKKDALTVQGDLYTGREGASIIHIFSVDPPDTDVLFTSSRLAGGNVLGRWSHEQSNRSNTTLQLYFDNYTRSGPEAFESRDTFDIDFDHHLTLSRRHDLIWGAGYRRSSDHTVGTIDQAFIPADRTLQQFGFFAQDEITLKPDRVFLTAGAKLERSTLGSFEFQPNVRIAWTPSKRHTFWASLSRASRTPARRDTDLDVGLAAFPDPAGSSTPVEAVLFGAPKIKSEHVVAWEAGYRAQPGGRVSLDLAAFFNVYDHLFSVEPQAPFTDPGPPIHIVFPLTFANKLHGETAGAEASANWKVTRRWTLSPGYALLTMHLHADPSSLDTSSAPDIEGSSPRHQAQLRSHLELGRGIAWDAAAYFTDRLPIQQVSGYTRVDTQLTWQIREKLTLSVAGQNLVQDHHVESLDNLTLVNASLIKRSAATAGLPGASGKADQTGFKNVLLLADILSMNTLSTSHRRLPSWRALLRTRSVILPLLLAVPLLFPARPQAQENSKDQAAGSTSQDDKAAQEARQAAGLDLDQLANMSMNVTSVTRKSEALFDAPAAIFVLTSEDIRRGGFTTLPEALRMVPGLYVAQITPHDWNISARGFTDVANDKMLVLVDGRSAYTPLHGGVNWDTIDLPLEDIDRIEVIRGPGGTLWGANAVNGVINIVTKSSKETQGATVSTTADVQEGYTNLTQYGGRAGDTLTYRAFGKSSYFEPLTSASGIGLPDRSRMFRGGIRTDWEPSKKDSITLEGGTYDGRFRETPLGSSIDTIALSKGSDVAMRWKHSVSDRSRFDISGYCDWYTRGGVAAEMRNTCALEFQHDYDFSKRSSLIWGGSLLSAADVTQSVVPGHRRDETVSGFLQYEFVLIPDRLRVLAGSKFEHNGFSGFEYQPQARAEWTPNKANAFWAAISRAVRVPSRTEDDLLVTLVLPVPNQNPVALSFTGSEELRSERLKAYETGYRYQAGKKASFDLSVFYNDYSRLITAATPVIEVLPTLTVIRSSLVNGGAAQTHGAELNMSWRPLHRWTLSSGITELRGSSIATAASPAHIFTIQSRLDLPRHIEFDSALYHASALRPLSNVLSVVPTQGVDTLNRVDAGLSWRPVKQWTMSVWGRNLQSARHRESPDATFAGAAGEVPRSLTVKLSWQSQPAATSSH